MIRALALAGPTACGKSDFALQMAESANAEIISVDSGAVYQDMNIGTAKPGAEVRARIRHHLIDVCTPDQLFSAGIFCRLAGAAAKEIAARGKTPLLVGGTMMYFYALAHGLQAAPDIPPEVRAAVRHDLQKFGARHMHNRLAELNPQIASQIVASDSQRISRALELVMTRQRDQETNSEAAIAPEMELSFILLTPPDRDRLRAAIATRLERMFADGLVAETESITKKYNLTPTCPPLRMAGYRQATSFLRKQCTHAEMQTHAYHATCQLAKRQLTWQKKWPTPLARTDPFYPQASQQLMETMKAFRDRENGSLRPLK